MEYKGYIGIVNYDEKAKLFHGEVINTRDVITFQGTSVKELENAFCDSVDDYLNWCADEGTKPEKPYSGKFNLRISPELHRKAAINAQKMNVSLNRFVEKAIIDEIEIFL
jgi:predicted HicB family RNase H-like nuclease